MRLGTLLCLILALLPIAIFASQETQSRTISNGDRLRMICEEEPTLNQVYTVTDDGLILVDFIGVVEVAGLTPTEAAQRIADRLVDDRILRSATVTITILEQELGSIAFSGALSVTGLTPFRAGMRLSDVISLAGPLSTANLAAIRILRKSGDMLTVNFNPDSLDNEFNPVLVEGDEIFVPMTERTGHISVLGGVESPGEIENACRHDSGSGDRGCWWIDLSGNPRSDQVGEGRCPHHDAQHHHLFRI